MGLTAIDQDFPWDSCEREDPRVGELAMPPAITSPKFPLYRPALVLQEMDLALCQINGLPAQTPPILCAFNALKRLGLPTEFQMQSADDLVLQPKQYETTGLGIQHAAPAIGSRIVSDMFTQYLRTGSRHFADLLNMTHHMFNRIGNLEFPTAMCPRHTDGSLRCHLLQYNRE